MLDFETIDAALADWAATQDRAARPASAQDETSPDCVVACIEIDNLKPIMQFFGCRVADAVVTETEARLRARSRDQALVRRIGQDRLVLAQTAEGTADSTMERLTHMLRPFACPLEVAGCTFRPILKIGVSTGLLAKTGTTALLEQAMAALTAATGDGQLHSFDPSLDLQIDHHRGLLTELRTGLAGGQVLPYFQPQIEALSGAITGFEALARWEHPTQGLILPDQFLTLIGAAGLGDELSRAVIPRALAALATWRRAGFDVPSLSLNLTAAELRSPETADYLIFEADRWGLAPSDLRIEILESAVVEEPSDQLHATIDRLHRLGLQVDLDDFGKGQASVWNLRSLAVDRLKIDRSFITALTVWPRRRELARAMIALARSLEIEVIAEGVETTSDWEALIALGCHGLQGYAIGRPMPARDVPRWMERYRHHGRVPGQIAMARSGQHTGDVRDAS